MISALLELRRARVRAGVGRRAQVMLQAPVDDQKEVNSHTGNTPTIINLTKNVD